MSQPIRNLALQFLTFYSKSSKVIFRNSVTRCCVIVRCVGASSIREYLLKIAKSFVYDTTILTSGRNLLDKLYLGVYNT